jgi:hypothetical protein
MYSSENKQAERKDQGFDHWLPQLQQAPAASV